MDWWVFFVLNYKGLKMVKSLTSIAGLACVVVVVVTDSLHLY
jgi:amino acid transporter